MKKSLLLLCLLLARAAAAQFADSLHLAAGTVATAATGSYQPFWVTANRFGTISDRAFDAATYLVAHNQHIFTTRPPREAGGPVRTGLYLGYGAALYNNHHFATTFFEQGYVRAGYGNWQLRAGRYQEVTGEVDPALSSGSLGISGNALPIPKVELAVTDYTPVPFTHGWVQFKGMFAHGWLGDTPDIKGALLHQKSLYLRVGKKQLSFYGGLTHFAQWGGTFASGQAPSRFADYLRIIVGASGNDNDPIYHQGPVDIANAVGNHLVIPEFGLTLRRPTHTLRLYTQTIFDKGVGDSTNGNQRDRLAGLKILSRDRLVGVSWEASQPAWLHKLLLEGIYTKYQGGPAIYQGRDNYYVNATYTMGWQYQNRIIGTPLFINRAAAADYQLSTDPQVVSNWSILSNRVVGVHLGATGSLTTKLTYRLLGTYVRHYGNYYNTAYFTPAKTQTFFLLELPYRLPHFTVTVAAAADAGDLSNNLAGMLRLEWRLK